MSFDVALSDLSKYCGFLIITRPEPLSTTNGDDRFVVDVSVDTDFGGVMSDDNGLGAAYVERLLYMNGICCVSDGNV